MTAHATLGASSAHRWMTCPGSVALCANLPDSRSAYAEEGTLAHDLAEICLRNRWNTADVPTDGEWSKYPADMREYVQVYIDYVRLRLQETGGRLLVEQKVDYSEWVPGGFGTADAVILAGRKVITIDLKYGQGVRVSATGNEQARLYCLGALSSHWFDLDDVEEAETVIVQPRLDHIDEERLTVVELLGFAEEARQAAELALTDSAPLVPGGDQCRFCRAKAVCPARAEQALAVAMDEFDEPTPAPATLTLEQIGSLLPRLDDVAAWVRDVQAYAFEQALAGKEVPGHKLVRGRSVRKWRPGAAELLWNENKDLFERKLLGIGAAEKILGKGSPLLAELTEKPEGRPTLVPDSDKRPAVQGAQSAADDFSS